MTGLILAVLLLQAYESRPTVQLPAREWGQVLATPDLTCRIRVDGKPIRSRVRRRLFLRMLGLGDAPPRGWYVDHIVPLACGGCDVPSNMSLLDEEQWRAKMLFERRICGQQGGSQ